MNFFTPDEIDFLKNLSTPEKLQDYIDNMPYNWCTNGYICKSAKRVLREKNAHCFEGALFAAAARRLCGYPPIVIDMHADVDDEHTIVPFQTKELWGAIGQSKTYVLKWRDPIFRSIRELVLSYFPFYLKNGRPMLKSYTNPIDLSQYDHMKWMTSDESLEELGDILSEVYHKPLYPESCPVREVPPELRDILIRWKIH